MFSDASSDSSDQAVAGPRSPCLQEKVEYLTRENESLRKQFDELVRISSQVDSVHQKNVKLESEMTRLKAENDNLEKRLEVSLNTAKELRRKMEDERKENEHQLQVDRQVMQKEALKVRESAKAQIDSVCKQAQGMMDDKEKAEIELKLMSTKFDKLLSTVSHYFDRDFNHVQEFIDFLEVTEKKPEPKVEVQDSGKVNELESKVRKEKAKNKALVAEKGKVDEQLKSVLCEKDEMERNLRQKLAAAELARKTEVAELELAISTKDHMLGSLEAQVKSLKGELAKSKTEKKRLEARLESAAQPVVVIENPVKKDNEMELEMDELLETNDDLLNQLRVTSEKRDEYLRKIREVEKKNIELVIQTEKQKHDLEAVAVVHKDTLQELERVKDALNAKEMQARKGEMKMKKSIQSHKSQVKALQSTVDRQKKQIDDLLVSKETADQTLESQTAAIEGLNQALSENKQTVEQLKEYLAARQRECQERQDAWMEESIPICAWTSTDLPAELNGLIDTVAKNRALQPVSKLQSVYRIIAKYFDKIVAARNQALDQAYSENQQIRESVHQFIVSISIALEVEPVTFENFFATDAPASMVKKILNIISALDAAERRKQSLESVVAFFDRQMGFAHDDQIDTAFQHVNDIKRKIDSQNSTIVKQRKKCKELEASLDALTKKSEEDNLEYTRRITTLNNTVSDFVDKLEAATAENLKLKKSIQKASCEFHDYKTKSEELLKRTQDVQERDVAKLKRENEQRISTLSSELENQKRQREAAERSLSEAQSSVRKLQKKLDRQEEKLNETEKALSEAKREAETKQANMAEENTKTKQQLVEKYEKTIEAIRSQSERHRSDLQKLSNELSQSQQEARKRKMKIIELKSDKVKADRDIHSLQAQMEREKKLAETSTKSAILTAETECAAKISEQKTKFEAERCKLFAYVADAFRQYYNPQEIMDECSFRIVVNQVRDKLKSLASSNDALRRLVNAPEYQNTYDAVVGALERRISQ